MTLILYEVSFGQKSKIAFIGAQLHTIAICHRLYIASGWTSVHKCCVFLVILLVVNFALLFAMNLPGRKNEEVWQSGFFCVSSGLVWGQWLFSLLPRSLRFAKTWIVCHSETVSPLHILLKYLKKNLPTTTTHAAKQMHKKLDRNTSMSYMTAYVRLCVSRSASRSIYVWTCINIKPQLTSPPHPTPPQRILD